MILYSASTGGFYDTAIHKKTPDDSVEVSAADHRALLDTQALGKVIEPDSNGYPQAVEAPDPPLNELESDLLRRIDRKASEVRARFITSGTGQSAVYLTKYEEARAYKGASDPADSDYPYIAKEANRRGMTVSDLADEVIATRNAWTDPAGAAIEAERVGGKGDVRKATTADDKRTAADNAIATLDGIKP